MKQAPRMPHAPPAPATDQPDLQPVALAGSAKPASAGSKRAPDIAGRRPGLHAGSSPSPLTALRGELARLDAAYSGALRRAVDARDAESISSRFAEADRLQRQMLAASRRLRAELGADEADATVSEPPDERGSTIRLERQASCDDAA